MNDVTMHWQSCTLSSVCLCVEDLVAKRKSPSKKSPKKSKAAASDGGKWLKMSAIVEYCCVALLLLSRG